MSRRLRQLAVLLLLIFGGRGCVFATVSATATLTISTTGASTASGGDLPISFNGFLETIHYGPFSTPESIAAGLAAMFSRDYAQFGLYAKADFNNHPATDDPAMLRVITFQFTNGDGFGSLSFPTTGPFAFTPSGFGTTGPVVADTGTVTLSVNGVNVAATAYGDGSTAASIAESLAASTLSSSVATVQAEGSLLYLTSKTSGSTTNYPFAISLSHDSADFTSQPFLFSVSSGNLAGGQDATSPSAPTSVYSYTLDYDAAGNVQTVTADTVMGSWGYTYDALNRLTTGVTSAGPYSTTYPDLCWSYDSFGNRTHQSLSNNSFSTGCIPTTGATLVDTSATYFANNQVSGSTIPGVSGTVVPTYDAAGNISNDGVNTTYLYDAEGRICAVHSPTGMTGYQYDAEGNRVGKGTIDTMSCDVTTNGYQPTSDFILDQANGQMTEMNIRESNTMTWQHTNVKVGSMLLATYDTAGLHFYLNDALGSRRVQTDGAGVVEQSCQSLAFGDQLQCSLSASAPTEHHFTGKERDAESGLDYFGARYYASNIGRFMTPDPGPYVQNDPQTWNRYAYTRNNPLKYLDPTGKYFVVAADNIAVQHYISTLLRSDAGKALVNSIAADPRPTFIDNARLPTSKNSDGTKSITNATTTAVAGSPGELGGTSVKIDPLNELMSGGKSYFGTELKAFTHELNHVVDMNAATSYQGAAAAGAAGDAPTKPGAHNTEGGTAEQRAIQIMSGLGDQSTNYTPNEQTDQQATQIIQSGNKQLEEEGARSQQSDYDHKPEKQ